MAEVKKFEVKKEIKCPADKFFDILKNNMTDLPKIHPEIYKSCEVLEGDGKSVGSVRLWKYYLDGPNERVCKGTIKAIDDENKSITLGVLEGDILNHYKSFNLKIQVSTKGDGSLVEWTVEYEKANEGITTPDELHQEVMAKICMGMDAYHHKP